MLPISALESLAFCTAAFKIHPCFWNVSHIIMFLFVKLAYHFGLYCRNLQKAESKLEKLGSALSEVDRKVAGLRDKFEKVQ